MTAIVGSLLALAGLAVGSGLGWMLARQLLSRHIRELQKALAQAQSEARTDPLTGLGNRKAFEERLAMLTAIARRYGGPLALIVFDLDGLKQVNDSRGHAAGDAALVHFASVLRDAARESDLSARIGGDEFAVLLPHTDARGAGALAKRIQQALQAAPCRWPSDAVSPATARQPDAPPTGILVLQASAGVTEWRPDDTPGQFFERADQALYRTKQASPARPVLGHVD